MELERANEIEVPFTKLESCSVAWLFAIIIIETVFKCSSDSTTAQISGIFRKLELDMSACRRWDTRH